MLRFVHFFINQFAIQSDRTIFTTPFLLDHERAENQMNWLADIFMQLSYLQTVVLLSIICAVGLAFGQIKFKGVSLGVTLVFFAGIMVGHVCNRLGIEVNWDMIAVAQNFGLILFFVYALGVQVGPGFFSSLKRGGAIRLNLSEKIEHKGSSKTGGYYLRG